MSALNSLHLRISLVNPQWRVNYRSISICSNALCNKIDVKLPQGEDDFRILDIGNAAVKSFLSKRGKPFKRAPVLPPRADRMPTDQDWPSVWPTARVFHPASVPLPLHQGWVEKRKGQVPPGKFANAELMKIPNFLHLTPPAIERQCQAIKKFCTPWPEGLETEEQMDRHFPVQVVSSDYCHSSPTIRDAKARIVTLQVKLESLPLDSHAKDKLLRLIKERYDEKTKTVSIIAERCPLRKQNLDYAVYLLNVLVSESWKTEKWETEKAEPDMEKYVWEGSPSQLNLQRLLSHRGGEKEIPTEAVQSYGEAVTRLHNVGEDMETVNQYKEAVKALLVRNK